MCDRVICTDDIPEGARRLSPISLLAMGHLNQMTTSGDRVQTDVANKVFSDDDVA